jgi:hypothetical protein
MKKGVKKRSKTLLENLVAAVGAYYAKDPTRAGVVLSDLGDGVWYCSVVRYNERMGGDKRLVCSTKQASLADAIRKCAEDFDEITRTPRQLFFNLEKTLKAMSKQPTKRKKKK